MSRGFTLPTSCHVLHGTLRRTHRSSYARGFVNHSCSHVPRVSSPPDLRLSGLGSVSSGNTDLVRLQHSYTLPKLSYITQHLLSSDIHTNISRPELHDFERAFRNIGRGYRARNARRGCVLCREGIDSPYASVLGSENFPLSGIFLFLRAGLGRQDIPKRFYPRGHNQYDPGELFPKRELMHPSFSMTYSLLKYFQESHNVV